MMTGEKSEVGQAERLPEVPGLVRELVDKGDYDGIENVFMARCEEPELDTGFLLGTLRLLVQRRRSERAGVLLDILLETIAAKKDDEMRHSIARTCLRFWPDCAVARQIRIGELKLLYAGSPNFDLCARHCGVETGSEPLKALECLETWLRYDEGRPVYMQTKGVGRVREINLSLETVRVDFEGQGAKPLSLRISEAPRLLEALPSGHFLARKLEDPAALREIAFSDPGEILRMLFESLARPLSTSEIKEMLSGVVSGEQWSQWWGRARQDGRLVVGKGSRPLCTWTGSADEADERLLEEFNESGPVEQLELARKHMSRSERVAGCMTEILMKNAEKALGREPSFACEIVLTLESRLPAASRASMPFDAAKLLGRDDVVGIVDGIVDRSVRRKALGLVRTVRDDWTSLYARFLQRESDSQSCQDLYQALQETDAGLVNETVRSAIAAPDSAPGFFTWICREVPGRPELKEFADWRLVKLIIEVLGNVSHKQYHAQLRKMFDAGQAVRIAIGTMDIEQAREFLSLLDHDIGLESFRKEELRRDLNTTFPDLTAPAHAVFYATTHAIESKREEFRRIVREDLPKNRAEIVKAKEFGDLSENFEYHAARARQEMLSSRAKTLEDQLKSVRLIEAAAVDPSLVTVGTRARLEPLSGTGGEIILTILGPWESDPSVHVLSHLAPAARELLGARVGDSRTYHGIEYRIAAIEPWSGGGNGPES